jgi:hypothetical protein
MGGNADMRAGAAAVLGREEREEGGRAAGHLLAQERKAILLQGWASAGKE